MLGVLELEITRFGGKHADHPLGATEGDQGLTGAHVSPQHHIEFVTHFLHPAAAANVPDHNFAAGRAHTTTGEHEPAAAAKPHDVRPSFGKWQHALEGEGVGVVEQNLPLTGNSGERCPLAGGNRGTGIQSGCVNRRLKWQAGGLRNHLGPLHRGARHCDVGLFLRQHGDAAFVLQHTAVNPLPKDFLLLLGDRRAIWRHRGLVFVGHQAEKITA